MPKHGSDKDRHEAIETDQQLAALSIDYQAYAVPNVAKFLLPLSHCRKTIDMSQVLHRDANQDGTPNNKAA